MQLKLFSSRPHFPCSLSVSVEGKEWEVPRQSCSIALQTQGNLVLPAKICYFHIGLMFSNRNAFATRKDVVPSKSEQRKVGERDGMVQGVILADVNSLTEMWVDKQQLTGKRV